MCIRDRAYVYRQLPRCLFTHKQESISSFTSVFQCPFFLNKKYCISWPPNGTILLFEVQSIKNDITYLIRGRGVKRHFSWIGTDVTLVLFSPVKVAALVITSVPVNHANIVSGVNRNSIGYPTSLSLFRWVWGRWGYIDTWLTEHHRVGPRPWPLWGWNWSCTADYRWCFSFPKHLPWTRLRNAELTRFSKMLGLCLLYTSRCV